MLGRTLRAIAIMLLVLVVCLHLALSIVLNVPVVQRAILSALNTRIFHGLEMQASMDSLSVSLFPPSLRLRNAQLERQGQSQACRGTSCQAKVTFDELRVGVKLTESYRKRQLVLGAITLDGGEFLLDTDDAGNLVLPLRIPSAPETEKDLRPLGTLVKATLPLLPEAVELHNITLKLGRLDAPPEPGKMAAAVVLRHATLARGANSSRATLDISSLSINHGSTGAKPLKHMWDASEVRLAATLGPDMHVDVERFAVVSEKLNVTAQGTVVLPQTPQETLHASAKLKAETGLDFLFSWLDLDAAGSVAFDGSLTWGGAGLPEAVGQLSWKGGARIKGYSLYEGKTNASLKGKAITASELQVRTPEGGRLAGNAAVTLEDDGVEIKAGTSIERLPFTTLMKGIVVPTNVVSFVIDSSMAEFGVSVRKNGESFSLRVDGPIVASELTVPALHRAGRTPIPACHGQLKLFTDYEHLDLKETWLSCNRDSSDKVLVREGTVRYKNGRTRFDLDVRRIELSHGQYFLLDSPEFFRSHPTAGVADMEAVISSEGGRSPVLFEAATQARDVSLYGVELKTLAGTWGIDERGVWGRNLKGSSGKEGEANIRLDTFRVNFDKEVSSLFEGSLAGPLPALLASVRGFLSADGFQGQIENGRFRVSGPLSPNGRLPHSRTHAPLAKWVEKAAPLLAWDSAIELDARNLEAFGIKARSAVASLSCKANACEKTRLAIELAAKDSQGRSDGFIFADLRKFSLDEVDLTLRARDVELRHFAAKDQDYRANATLALDISGSWDNYRAWLQGGVDGVHFGNLSLGAFSITGETSPRNPIDLRLLGHYGQLRARLRAPQSLSGLGQAYISFNGFDFSGLLPQETRLALNLMGQVDAEFHAEGPAPFTPPGESSVWRESLKKVLAHLGWNPSPNAAWHESWRVWGEVNKVSGYFKQIPFATEGVAKVEFVNEKLAVKGLRLLGGTRENRSIEAKANAELNLRSLELRADGSLHSDLHVLPQLLQQFGPSSGTLDVSVRAQGRIPEISWTGEGRVRKGDILVQTLPPAFRNVDLHFTFNDKSVEIDSLHGNKGEGTFEASGTVGWEGLAAKRDTLPTLRLDVTTNHFQSRIPIPVLQYLDTEVDASLSLCRKESCEDLLAETDGNEDEILIAGNLTLHDAHVTRGLDCSTILNAAGKPEAPPSPDTVNSLLNRLRLALVVEAPGTLSVNTACARSRLSVNSLQVEGTAAAPRLLGRIETADTSGSGQLGNIRFLIENALLDFDGRYDNPNYDVLISTSMAGYGIDRQRIDYKVFIHLEGRPLDQKNKQPEIRAEPPTHPDGQRPLTQTDLVAMVLTGRGPDASSPIGISTEFIANEVATAGTNAIFSEAKVENSVSRMFNRLSAGIVDRVSIEPVFDGGRPRFRLQATMIPIETVNVNVETNQDPSGTESSARNGALTAAWVLNNRINLGLDLRRKEIVGTTPITMGTGIVFRFGGE